MLFIMTNIQFHLFHRDRCLLHGVIIVHELIELYVRGDAEKQNMPTQNPL